MTPTPLIDGAMEIMDDLYKEYVIALVNGEADLKAKYTQRISDFARAYAGKQNKELVLASQQSSVFIDKLRQALDGKREG